jgi:hypothetical protein
MATENLTPQQVEQMALDGHQFTEEQKQQIENNQELLKIYLRINEARKSGVDWEKQQSIEADKRLVSLKEMLKYYNQVEQSQKGIANDVEREVMYKNDLKQAETQLNILLQLKQTNEKNKTICRKNFFIDSLFY